MRLPCDSPTPHTSRRRESLPAHKINGEWRSYGEKLMDDKRLLIICDCGRIRDVRADPQCPKCGVWAAVEIPHQTDAYKTNPAGAAPPW